MSAQWANTISCSVYSQTIISEFFYVNTSWLSWLFCWNKKLFFFFFLFNNLFLLSSFSILFLWLSSLWQEWFFLLRCNWVWSLFKSVSIWFRLLIVRIWMLWAISMSIFTKYVVSLAFRGWFYFCSINIFFIEFIIINQIFCFWFLHQIKLLNIRYFCSFIDRLNGSKIHLTNSIPFILSLISISLNV